MEQRALWDKSVGDYTAKLKVYGIQFVTLDKKLFDHAGNVANGIQTIVCSHEVVDRPGAVDPLQVPPSEQDPAEPETTGADDEVPPPSRVAP
jgi:hypothetical protein